MKVSTQFLREFVDIKPPLERLADRLTLAGLEVKKIEAGADKKEVIFEVEVTTNRPDWLSHLGVAREIAAVENLSLKLPPIEPAAHRQPAPGWKLHLKEPEGCPYYTAVYIEGISSARTPDFMAERLAACGIRPISLLVDITNYVLLETGQPLHAFDADRLRGQEIQIRRAKAGEKFLSIEGSELKLEASDLLIADAEGGVALAGVMGGRDSEINERTRNVLLESAYFHPRWVRQTSRRHRLSSESSYRFERRVDPEGVDFARDRALYLIRQYAKPRFVSAVLKAGEKPRQAVSTLHLPLGEVERWLGVKFKPHQVSSILTRLGLEVKPDSAESFKVQIPTFRSDLTRPVDLIEEVARIHGYDEIPETLPAREPIYREPHPRLELEDRARDFFSAAGYHETVTFSLISKAGFAEADLKDAVSVINLQNQDLGMMRPAFFPGLLAALQKNDHLGAAGAAIFEVANLYRQPASQGHPQEEKCVGLALMGKVREKGWMDPEREAAYYDLKGSLESFLDRTGIEGYLLRPVEKSYLKKISAEEITLAGQAVGFLGEVKPEVLKLWGLERRVYLAELSLNKLAEAAGGIRKYHEVSRYPSVERDLSLQVAESVKSGEIIAEIRRHGQGLISRVELFDLYRGERIPKGCKNLAFRIIYQSRERTLLSEEVRELHTGIARRVVQKFQASFQ